MVIFWDGALEMLVICFEIIKNVLITDSNYFLSLSFQNFKILGLDYENMLWNNPHLMEFVTLLVEDPYEANYLHLLIICLDYIINPYFNSKGIYGSWNLSRWQFRTPMKQNIYATYCMVPIFSLEDDMGGQIW